MGFPDGVNLETAKLELQYFVDNAAPKLDGVGHYSAKCGRTQALQLTERVRPILDVLYPEWRTENARGKYFEFASEHDASIRLIERIGSAEELVEILGDRNQNPKLFADQLHPLVWSSAAVQWSTGHRHEAVFAASKAVNSLLQSKVDRRDVSEMKLVQEAFSDKEPIGKKLRLRFPEIADEQTRESMRQGVMQFGSGCFQAIRNPVGHLPNDEFELTEQEALERLSALSLLARWIDQAQVIKAE